MKLADANMREEQLKLGSRCAKTKLADANMREEQLKLGSRCAKMKLPDANMREENPEIWESWNLGILEFRNLGRLGRVQT